MKVRYDAGTANVCGSKAIDKKDLNVLATTACADANLILKINSLYQGNFSNTNSIRIGKLQPCDSTTTDPFTAHYTLTGNRTVGDSIKLQLSNIMGVFGNAATNNTDVLIRKKYTTTGTGQLTDSLKTSVPLTTPGSTNYKLRLVHKKAGTSIVKYDTLRYNLTVGLFGLGTPCNNNGGNRTVVNSQDTDEKATLFEHRNDLIKVYPNPNNGLFKVILPQQYSEDSEVTQISIVNLNGQIVSELSTHQFEIDWNLEGLPTGVYFLRVNHLDKTSVQKLVITH
jgi:hypothetical protein